MELVGALNTILVIVQTMTMETLASDKLDLVQEIENWLEDKKVICCQFISERLPLFQPIKMKKWVIDLFKLHGYLQELEHFISKVMKDFLKSEDYINCISIVTILKDYCWVLMGTVKRKFSGIEVRI